MIAPESENDPSVGTQSFVDLFITLYITLYLGDPELTVGMDLLLPALPIVSMPELAVAEDGDLLTDECNVRMTLDTFAVLTIAEASGPKLLAQHQLDGRVPGTDGLHVPVTLLGSETIHD